MDELPAIAEKEITRKYNCVCDYSVRVKRIKLKAEERKRDIHR